MVIRNDVAKLTNAPTPTGNPVDEKLKKTCKDFESFLIGQMFTKMRDSIPKTDLFGSKEQEDMFQGMIDQQVAQQVSAGGNMQLAEVLYKQLAEKIKNP